MTALVDTVQRQAEPNPTEVANVSVSSSPSCCESTLKLIPVTLLTITSCAVWGSESEGLVFNLFAKLACGFGGSAASV